MSKHILAHLSKADAVLGGLIRAVGPCALDPQDDCHPFQALAQAIAHQQLNGTAANTILKRLVHSCGRGVFPTPQMVLDASADSLRAAGFSFAKVAALKDLAAKTLAAVVPEGAVLMELPDEEIIERLTQVRGIGRWTVEMLLMFRLGRPDVLPVDDFGVRAGFRAAYGLSRMPKPQRLAAWGGELDTRRNQWIGDDGVATRRNRDRRIGHIDRVDRNQRGERGQDPQHRDDDEAVAARLCLLRSRCDAHERIRISAARRRPAFDCRLPPCLAQSAPGTG